MIILDRKRYAPLHHYREFQYPAKSQTIRQLYILYSVPSDQTKRRCFMNRPACHRHTTTISWESTHSRLLFIIRLNNLHVLHVLFATGDDEWRTHHASDSHEVMTSQTRCRKTSTSPTTSTPPKVRAQTRPTVRNQGGWGLGEWKMSKGVYM